MSNFRTLCLVKSLFRVDVRLHPLRFPLDLFFGSSLFSSRCRFRLTVSRLEASTGFVRLIRFTERSLSCNVVKTEF